MIIVHVHARIDPADQDRFQAAALVMQEKTRAEDGSVDYRWARAVEDPNVLVLREEWRDAASLDVHLASEHMAAFGDVLTEIAQDGVQIDRFEAGEAEHSEL